MDEAFAGIKARESFRHRQKLGAEPPIDCNITGRTADNRYEFSLLAGILQVQYSQYAMTGPRTVVPDKGMMQIGSLIPLRMKGLGRKTSLVLAPLWLDRQYVPEVGLANLHH